MPSCLCLNCLRFLQKIKTYEWRKDVNNSSPNRKIEVNTDKTSKDMMWTKVPIASVPKSASFDDEACCGSNKKDTFHCGNIQHETVPDEKSFDSYHDVVQSSTQETDISEEWGDDLPPLPPGFKLKQIQVEVEGSSAPLATGATQRISIRSKQSSTHTEQLTLLSDWGDVFDDYGSMDFTKSGSLVLEKDTSWSISDNLTGRESRLSLMFSPKHIHLAPGKVMGMFIKKKDYRFQILNLNSTLDKVVDVFLLKESGTNLRLSFSKSGLSRPKVMSNSRMKNTLANSLGPQFDAKKQGVVFAMGPVNSKLCYKMSVCELSKIEKIFSLIHPKSSCET